MYQMTDAAFAEARPYCIRHHIVVEDGCSLTGLDSRVRPSRAIELTAVFLDRKVTAILARPRSGHRAGWATRAEGFGSSPDQCDDAGVPAYRSREVERATAVADAGAAPSLVWSSGLSGWFTLWARRREPPRSGALERAQSNGSRGWRPDHPRRPIR